MIKEGLEEARRWLRVEGREWEDEMTPWLLDRVAWLFKRLIIVETKGVCNDKWNSVNVCFYEVYSVTAFVVKFLRGFSQLWGWI